ncbi:glyoxalase/bleomycin resistance/extradiol dioxygenase family protein [Flaviaesturariibacter flavus]|uniref:Glyoxalase/bleomycin resistance/extradiol dioxygenase family protein n=1 Tax=Flaviaesturariibacter flavus TaxID=2502780 RepID=A0A4R1BNQ9_9BACT|nr:VOC family protein [Flaviaesturariibacter flavus]TCJ19233.1 glyoxalase/bleomycin resistance/extradiol dioxygenase family protein [Flaviaesturariibacter flavus]
MANKIFVNLPVQDLQKSMDFFRHLGFGFNMQFTNHAAACLVLGDNIFAMLLTHEHFAAFTKKPIADARQTTEVLIALDAESREAVDTMVRRAVEAGGTIYADPQDHGWMYGHSFADLDGHQWEIGFMDEAALKQMMNAQGAANAGELAAN